jgi:hypothetical protein
MARRGVLVLLVALQILLAEVKQLANTPARHVGERQ